MSVAVLRPKSGWKMRVNKEWLSRKRGMSRKRYDFWGKREWSANNQSAGGRGKLSIECRWSLMKVRNLLQSLVGCRRKGMGSWEGPVEVNSAKQARAKLTMEASRIGFSLCGHWPIAGHKAEDLKMHPPAHIQAESQWKFHQDDVHVPCCKTEEKSTRGLHHTIH